MNLYKIFIFFTLMKDVFFIGLVIFFQMLLHRTNQASSLDYLKDLEEFGYCVVPEVISRDETKVLYERVWREYIEKAWSNCKKDREDLWDQTFPIQNRHGIFGGHAAHIQVMWDVRQDPRIVEIFSRIWNTEDLIVSMDGICLMCPPELRQISNEPWPHVDLPLFKGPDRKKYKDHFLIQGQFLFEDSFEGDGGFYCIPKSHFRFFQWSDRFKYQTKKNTCLWDFFRNEKDELGFPYEAKHVIAPKGSLILWDVRTVHWSQFPSIGRKYSNRVRMVGYISYAPKERLCQEAIVLRKKAFEEKLSTGHSPCYPRLKKSEEHIEEGFDLYIEDPTYKPSPVFLTPLGKALLW